MQATCSLVCKVLRKGGGGYVLVTVDKCRANFPPTPPLLHQNHYWVKKTETKGVARDSLQMCRTRFSGAGEPTKKSKGLIGGELRPRGQVTNVARGERNGSCPHPSHHHCSPHLSIHPPVAKDTRPTTSWASLLC